VKLLPHTYLLSHVGATSDTLRSEGQISVVTFTFQLTSYSAIFVEDIPLYSSTILK